jgi:hypothetical protein
MRSKTEKEKRYTTKQMGDAGETFGLYFQLDERRGSGHQSDYNQRRLGTRSAYNPRQRGAIEISLASRLSASIS